MVGGWVDGWMGEGYHVGETPSEDHPYCFRCCVRLQRPMENHVHDCNIVNTTNTAVERLEWNAWHVVLML